MGMQEDAFIEQLYQEITKSSLIQDGQKVVVGFSGGVDSVALLYGLDGVKRRGLDFEVYPIYVHHGLREDADDDVALCQMHCRRLELPLEVVHVHVRTFCKKHHLSEEDGARQLRYASFYRHLKKIQGQSIVLAHHMDDQAETVLHRFIRGSGLLGLKGMEMKNRNLIRPMLHMRKNTLIHYCNARELAYVTDSTNAETVYTRNRIRLELIPYLEESFNPNIVESLHRLSCLMADEEEYMEQQAKHVYDNVATSEADGSCRMNIPLLMDEAIAMQRRVVRLGIKHVVHSVKHIEFQHVERVIGLLYQQSGKEVPVRNGLKAVREFDALIICKDIADNKIQIQSYTLDTLPIKGYIQGAKLYYNVMQVSPSIYKDSLKNTENMYTKWFDYDKIKANLVLRTRQPGDILHIDDDGHTKTLKKFFIDEKIAASKRDQILLLTDGHYVLWVVGYRINPIYAAKASSSAIIKVELTKEDKNGSKD